MVCGFKSLEVIQAFSFLVCVLFLSPFDFTLGGSLNGPGSSWIDLALSCRHWASPAASWAQDRSWSTLGLAMYVHFPLPSSQPLRKSNTRSRIGSELRVDLPLEPREIAQYRRLSGIPDLSVALLEGNRMRCASLLFLSELA